MQSGHVEVFYADLYNFPIENLYKSFELLPRELIEEVQRYRFENDKKATMMGKLMLLTALYREHQENLVKNIRRDRYNKPIIEGWRWFNISHSGRYVVFCSSLEPIGIDIEQHSNIHINDYLSVFNETEAKSLLNAKDQNASFYACWTRKEAYLKAIGTGFLGEVVDDYNCLDNPLYLNSKKWYFKSIPIAPGYTCHLCKENVVSDIFIEPFQPAVLADMLPAC